MGARGWQGLVLVGATMMGAGGIALGVTGVSVRGGVLLFLAAWPCMCVGAFLVPTAGDDLRGRAPDSRVARDDDPFT